MAYTMFRIDTKVGLWKKGEASEAWLEGADWVVDAIDNVPTKVSWTLSCNSGPGHMLIEYCLLVLISGRLACPLSQPRLEGEPNFPLIDHVPLHGLTLIHLSKHS